MASPDVRYVGLPFRSWIQLACMCEAFGGQVFTNVLSDRCDTLGGWRSRTGSTGSLRLVVKRNVMPPGHGSELCLMDFRILNSYVVQAVTHWLWDQGSDKPHHDISFSPLLQGCLVLPKLVGMFVFRRHRFEFHEHLSVVFILE